MLRRNALSDSTQGRLAAGATHAVGANTLMLRRLAFLTPLICRIREAGQNPLNCSKSFFFLSFFLS
jgi:hypothetical protein